MSILLACLPDVDHIRHLKVAFRDKAFPIESRSLLHEFPGLLGMIILSVTVSIFYPDLYPGMYVSSLSHHLIDFLTRPTRPFYPISKEPVLLGVYPTRLCELIACDVILTVALLFIGMVA